MLYFVSNKKHEEFSEVVNLLDAESGIGKLFELLNHEIEMSLDKPVIGYDLETNGLDAYINDILLIIIGTETEQFVLDATCEETLSRFVNMYDTLKDEIIILGHNIKFDFKFTKANLKIEFLEMYDTMITEQRLMQGGGVKAGLLPTLQRSSVPVPEAMDKEVRLEFVGKNPKYIKFTNDQIEYAAGDIAPLFPLFREQWDKVIKYKMEFLLKGIEFPLIRILGLCELEGYVLNTSEKDGWRKIILDNKKEVYRLECELDQIVRDLRDDLLKDKPEMRQYLVGGQWDRKRNRYVEQINVGLFGEAVTLKALTGKATKPKIHTGNTNYGSTTQIRTIFGRLGQELCTLLGKAIPQFENNGKVEKSRNGDKFVTGRPELEAFLITNHDTPMAKFISTLLEFRTCNTEINNFGENYIEKINPVTGKIHTIFRQAGSENGRLKSGGGKLDKDKFNSQNVPAKPKFRECFGTDKGYKIVTCDLSGAEVTVMASKAQDFKLLELTGDDIHSHMAQRGWRNIFYFRYKSLENKYKSVNKLPNAKHQEMIDDYKDKAHNFIVSKKVNNKSHRKPCKNLTFGTVYGCHSKKAGKTLNISKEEGQTYIDTIKKEIPDTFRMVEDNVRTALHNGFLILNTRTNSRIWFPTVIQAKKHNYELDFMDRVKVDGQARNIPMSGTQADMLKEAMVDIQVAIDKNDWDCTLLGQVHDELIYKFPETKEYDFFPQFVADKMCEASNRYLVNVKMGADYEVKYTWTK